MKRTHALVGLVVVVTLSMAMSSAAQAATVTFDNTTAITIPTSGNGSPYPSPIGVSGFSGPVEDVNVTLNHLQHPSDTDLSVLLVGPGGQSTILMSDAGSFPGSPPPDETFTLDDEAATSLPLHGSLTPVPPGSYKPTRSAIDPHPEAFGSPAPAGPYPVALSVFDGTSANGNWSLFVRDEATSDGGTISGGWSLAITAPAPPSAAPDLTAPTVAVSGASKAVPFSKFLKGLKLTLTPDEPASLDVTLQGTPKSATLSAFELPLASASLGLAGGSRSVTLKPRKKFVGKPRKRFRVRLRIVATDSKGNQRTIDQAITIKPNAHRKPKKN